MKKKEIIFIVTVISVLASFIVDLSFPYQLGWIKLFIIIPFVYVISMVIIHKQKVINLNMESNKLSYNNLDFIKYIFAIMIIILHIRPFLLSSSLLDLTFNNIITRICVPYFFLVTGYFVAKKEKERPNYCKEYIKNTLPVYFKWSIIYIPIILIIFVTHFYELQNISFYTGIPYTYVILFLILFSPAICIIVLSYVGVYYHLWYFPALLLSIWVLSKWKQRFQIKTLLIIAFILLLFGATETYFGYLPITIKAMLQYYFKIFFTTRNFLFFGLFYVVFGYYLGSKNKIVSKNCFVKLLLSIVLLILEGLFLQYSDRLNSNILLSCVPLVYYLFVSTLYFNNLFTHKRSKQFREYSKYYYLVHPAILFFLSYLTKNEFATLFHSIYGIVLALILTHVVSYGILCLKVKFPKLNI